MQWNSGHDESVEVNQRALIDKVLARYSGEFTGMGDPSCIKHLQCLTHFT